MKFVSCYRCGRHFEADTNQIDTRCPFCGCDSFVSCRGQCIQHLANEPGRHRSSTPEEDR